MYIFGYNIVLTIVVISWFTAQTLKAILHWIKTKRFSAERLTGAGGVPSCHSATVCSLTMAVARTEGVKSTIFAMAIVFAFVVMYDAMGVRRAAGLHAKELNRIRRAIDEYDGESDGKFGDYEIESEDKKDLKEYLGHTPLEVLGGALLGILIAMAYPISG